jgi:hypothetical protein
LGKLWGVPAFDLLKRTVADRGEGIADERDSDVERCFVSNEMPDERHHVIHHDGTTQERTVLDKQRWVCRIDFSNIAAKYRKAEIDCAANSYACSRGSGHSRFASPVPNQLAHHSVP